MKLDCILTACNDNTMYSEFIPIFVKTWQKLYPDIDVKIIYISTEELPLHLIEYKSNLILFKPIEGVSTAFTSQIIRILYPCIMNYENGVMITDMDMLPTNNTYYTRNIEAFDNNKFIYMRDVLLDIKQLAICYNVATPLTWKDIFKIDTIEDIRQYILTVSRGASWSTDQLILYKAVHEWNVKTKNFICLKDSETGYNRLDRNGFRLNKHMITNHLYSDYHCLRPYEKHKLHNDTVYNLL